MQATQALGAAYLVLAMLVSAVVITAVQGLSPILGDRLGAGMPSMLLHAIVVAIIVVIVYAIAWLIGRTSILGRLVHGLAPTRWYRRYLDLDARAAGLMSGSVNSCQLEGRTSAWYNRARRPYGQVRVFITPFLIAGS